MLFLSLKKIFSSPYTAALYILLALIAGVTWWITTDVKITLGNLGAEGKTLYVYLDILVSIFIVLLFPLFITGFIYRWYSLGNKSFLKGKSWVGMIGWIVSTILSGCSCCGVTLASYLGLLPLMSFMPYEWLLWIKILWLIALLYSLYDLLRNLESCKIKKKA